MYSGDCVSCVLLLLSSDRPLITAHYIIRQAGRRQVGASRGWRVVGDTGLSGPCGAVLPDCRDSEKWNKLPSLSTWRRKRSHSEPQETVTLTEAGDGDGSCHNRGLLCAAVSLLSGLAQPDESPSLSVTSVSSVKWVGSSVSLRGLL